MLVAALTLLIMLTAACSGTSQTPASAPADPRPVVSDSAAVVVGTEQPQSDGATACARFVRELLGGSPTGEQESAAVARSSVFATDDLGRRLRSVPPAGDVWRLWRAAGIRQVLVDVVAPEGGEAPPAGSPYVAYTAVRRPQPPGPRTPAQRWQVLCATTQAPAGWLVSGLDLEPQLPGLVR